MPIEFHWIVPDQLAGSGQPGLMGSIDDDLEWLEKIGIRAVVTLTEAPLRLSEDQLGGFRWLHFPIDDMGIPTPRRAAGVVQEIVESIARGEPVVVHCKAGLGRTGTMLSCCLVSLGQEPDDAIASVRRICPNYIQRQRQERFVHDFARFLAAATAADLGCPDQTVEEPTPR